ncbi:unnamed protein product, partial [Rotaria socialis]
EEGCSRSERRASAGQAPRERCPRHREDGPRTRRCRLLPSSGARRRSGRRPGGP